MLETASDETPEDEHLRNEIIQTKEELEVIYEEQTKGARIRCKVRWYEEGEKSNNKNKI